MEWLLIAILMAGYILLPVMALVLITHDWHRQEKELAILQGRIVKLETEVKKLKQPKRITRPTIQHRRAGDMWRYSGRGW